MQPLKAGRSALAVSSLLSKQAMNISVHKHLCSGWCAVRRAHPTPGRCYKRPPSHGVNIIRLWLEAGWLAGPCSSAVTENGPLVFSAFLGPPHFFTVAGSVRGERQPWVS